jgi:hypothetical protein
MADVYSVFGTLLALGIAFPGLLSGVWLLFPDSVERAQQRLERTPYQSLFFGLGAALATALVVSVLSAVPAALFKFVGALAAFAAFAVATIGAAGATGVMSARLQLIEGKGGPASAFVRSALALELGAAFPIVGWFVILPACLVVSYGAGLFALLRWKPRPSRAAEPEPVLRSA